MIKEEAISKSRILFLVNAIIYLTVSIIIIRLVIADDRSPWIFFAAYGMAFIFWTIAGVFANGFFKEEQQGKDTRGGYSAEVAFVRLVIQIFFIPARSIGARWIKNADNN
ncbi:MAG: hypothetical protein ACTSVZ_05220 [Promethearchaeota archaeon]